MSNRATLSLAAIILTGLVSSACFTMSQPGAGESCDEASFMPYCCSDTLYCECIDGVVDTYDCNAFCEYLDYNYGGECKGSDIDPDDPFYFCGC